VIFLNSPLPTGEYLLWKEDWSQSGSAKFRLYLSLLISAKFNQNLTPASN